MKQLYAASNEFSNFEAMLRLLNRYEDLVLADSEATDPKVYKPCASLLVPGLLVKSRAMVLDSLCKIGERNAELITFANDVLCKGFFDSADLVNPGFVGSETLPYISCCNSPLGYGRASCNTWNRAQVMEVVARNVENMKNPNRQRALEYFIQDGAIGEQRAWIVDGFCEVPDSVIDSHGFVQLCEKIASNPKKLKMMSGYNGLTLGLSDYAIINAFCASTLKMGSVAMLVDIGKIMNAGKFDHNSKKAQLYTYLLWESLFRESVIQEKEHNPYYYQGEVKLKPEIIISPDPSTIHPIIDFDHPLYPKISEGDFVDIESGRNLEADRLAKEKAARIPAVAASVQ